MIDVKIPEHLTFGDSMIYNLMNVSNLCKAGNVDVHAKLNSNTVDEEKLAHTERLFFIDFKYTRVLWYIDIWYSHWLSHIIYEVTCY